MTLPTLVSKKYSLKLPVLKKEIEFREMLVKEEKILLMANETKDEKEKIEAILQVLENCTFGKLDVKNMPYQDFEFLFVKIRAKSVNNISEFILKCKECDAKSEHSIDLNLISATSQEEHSDKIQLNETYGVKMKYPSILDIVELEKDKDFFKIFSVCIEYIYDNENVYPLKDASKEEIEDFIGSLTIEQRTKINTFFETTPRLKEVFKYKCKKCSTENEIVFEGLEDFFS